MDTSVITPGILNPKTEKFINYIMKSGKKATARALFKRTLDAIKAF